MNTDINNIEEMLNIRGVKPTANRILVMKELMKASNPVNLADMEVLLEFSMDKASIFRVLELFAEKDVVHVIEDGSRSLKYELCHSGTKHSQSIFTTATSKHGAPTIRCTTASMPFTATSRTALSGMCAAWHRCVCRGI